jgi:hypothetical protein
MISIVPRSFGEATQPWINAESIRTSVLGTDAQLGVDWKT